MSDEFGYREAKPYLRQLFKQAIYITESVLPQTDMKEVCKLNRDCLLETEPLAISAPEIRADDANELLKKFNARGKGSKEAASSGSKKITNFRLFF